MPGPQSESAIIPAVVALPESNRSPLPLGGVSGMPTLIQSRFGNKGNFELLTPMVIITASEIPPKRAVSLCQAPRASDSPSILFRIRPSSVYKANGSCETGQRIICFQSTAHAYKLFRARPNRIRANLSMKHRLDVHRSVARKEAQPKFRRGDRGSKSAINFLASRKIGCIR